MGHDCCVFALKFCTINILTFVNFFDNVRQSLTFPLKKIQHFYAIFRLSMTIFPTSKKSEKSRDEIGRGCVLVNDTDFKLTLKSTSLVSSFAKLIFIINVVILPGALQFTTPSLRKGHIFNINSISKVNANIIFRPKCQAPSPGYSLLLQTSYKENVYPDANMERGISF